MELKDIVVISACRTPMGRFGGTLKAVPSYDLGAVAIREAVKRAGIEPSQVSDVIFGNCRQAGNGPNPARTASVRGGIPMDVPVATVNMACPSGMKCTVLASQAIRLGEAETVMVGGMDSMSTIPYLLKDCRWDGFKMGNRTLEDGWSDSIDPLCGCGMGETAENMVAKFKISRADQDAFAAESHKKATTAQQQGLFDEEVVKVEIPQKKGDPIVLARDETPRADSTAEKLAKLPAVFRKEGTVTAGNACGMSDGACAMVITSREWARAHGRKPLFSLVAWAQTAVEPTTMGEGPGLVIPLALKNAGMKIGDVDLIEVNEAFAIQVLANERTVGWDHDRLNVNGGAIALGHPTGISGARILVTLYHALKQRDKSTGLASICGGGGVTMAVVIQRET